MPHLDDGLLHALLDGEIPSVELPAIQAHLAACSECRGRLNAEGEMQSEADRLVAVLEVPTLDRAPPPVRTSSRPRRLPIRELAWAASLVLAVGLGYVARGIGARAPVPVRGSTGSPAQPDLASGGAPAIAPGTAATALADQPAAIPKGALRGKSAATPPPPKTSAPDETGTLREPPTAADTAAARLDVRAASGAAAPPAVPEPVPLPPMAAQAARPTDQAARRNEGVTRGVVGALRSAKAAPAPATAPIDLTEAMRRLGGTLRLIEGMIPARLEAAGEEVRVIYPLERGELILSQRLSDGRVVYSLFATIPLPADSLARLLARVRE